MIILGIDLSLNCTGYAILDDRNLIYVDKIQFNKVKTDKRILIIYNKFEELIKTYKPDIVKIEAGFAGGKNQKSAINLAYFRGVILLLCERFNIKYLEYAPLSIKKHITGSGKADKKDIYNSLKNIYKDNNIFKNIGEFSDKSNLNKTDDMYDAIAISLMPVVIK